MKKITTSILNACLLLISVGTMAQTFTNYTTSNGLPHDNVNCLVQDTAGNMWFGTQLGLAKFDGVSTWTYYTTTSHPTLVHDVIMAIAVDADNNIWAGTDYGVCKFDGSTFTTYTTVDGLGNNRINHIKQAANGDIWFGEFSGATKYDGTTFTAYGTGDGLPFGGVNYIDFDSSGDVYMASGLGGFVQYDGTTFTIYNQTNGLLSNVVRSITVDAADNKWVGTAKGVSVFNSSNTWVAAHTIMLVLPAPDTLNPVEDIKITSQGDVWTGIYVDYLVTEGGVATLNGAVWDDYDVSDGLVGPVVRKMWIDTQDNIWVATSTGVSKISMPNGIEDLLTKNRISVYPNPTTDNINIVLQDNMQLKNNSIELYNASFQLVKQVNINPSQQQVKIEVEDLDRGMYFVKVDNHVSKIILN